MKYKKIFHALFLQEINYAVFSYLQFKLLA